MSSSTAHASAAAYLAQPPPPPPLYLPYLSHSTTYLRAGSTQATRCIWVHATRNGVLACMLRCADCSHTPGSCVAEYQRIPASLVKVREGLTKGLEDGILCYGIEQPNPTQPTSTRRRNGNGDRAHQQISLGTHPRIQVQTQTQHPKPADCAPVLSQYAVQSPGPSSARLGVACRLGGVV
jgi:hypothetical protein